MSHDIIDELLDIPTFMRLRFIVQQVGPSDNKLRSSSPLCTNSSLFPPNGVDFCGEVEHAGLSFKIFI